MASRYGDSLPDMRNLSVNDSFEYIHQRRGGLLNIVAIGKTGEGKSATINTLIKHSSDPNNLFKEEESPNSVTKRYNECTVKICDVNCRLIDTIGLFDTDETRERYAELQFGTVPDVVDAHKVVLQSLASVISLCTEGIDAFLLVIDGTRRVTVETTETINVILRYFGASMLDHCIIILTNSDRAATGTLQQMERKIAEYLRRIGYNNIGDRFIHFDNKTRPKQNVVTLLHAIEENLKNHNGQPYTNIAFKEAQKVLASEREKLQKEMDTKLKNLIEIETDKIRKDYQQQMQTIQRQLNEKAQLISKLSADAVEERKKFQREVNNLNNQMDNLEKNRDRDIATAVKSATEQCKESYQEQFRMMENQFQQQNKLLAESNLAVAALQATVEELKNRPPREVHHYHESSGGGGCFTGDCIVNTSVGKKTMRDLKIGDMVLSAANDGTVEFVPVVMWLQIDPNEGMEFFEISTNDGDVLIVTKNHKVFMFPSKNSDSTIDIDADKLVCGDFLCKFNGSKFVPVEVEKVSSKWKAGIFSPLTSSGKVVVDGILCSCYARITTGYVLYSHNTAHLFCTPMIWLLWATRQSSVATVLSKGYLFGLISLNRFLTRAVSIKSKFITE